MKVLVDCVTAKRFNSVFKQFVMYRKTTDLFKHCIRRDLFFENGIGLRENDAMFYTITACIFMLSMRLKKDYPMCTREFITLNCTWMVEALKPYITNVKMDQNKLEMYNKSIQGQDVFEWLELKKRGFR